MYVGGTVGSRGYSIFSQIRVGSKGDRFRNGEGTIPFTNYVPYCIYPFWKISSYLRIFIKRLCSENF